MIPADGVNLARLVGKPRASGDDPISPDLQPVFDA